ncbi:MAG: SUMF1/EgtB/PvdO family nonheme iron enzyme [Bacteroidetes bacterium]|nr:SUMF1/EgtB/PvdO family nonheme iron enzyme [Bacteroidota bacterium]
MKKPFLILSLGIMIIALRANNIAVTNVSLTDQSILFNHCNVKFDLSWDNSWRASGVPGNWDAAWVFVKYRVAGGEWHHASLDTAAGNHTPAAGSQITPSSDFKGVFIYRSSNGAGSNAWTNVKLRWKYGRDGVPDDASLEVKVFAIEMVLIPQGNFYIGDGNGTSESQYAFHDYNADNTAQLIDNFSHGIKVDASSTYDDNYIKWTSPGNYALEVEGDNGIATNGPDPQQNNHDYPTGYTAFYIMKYETSQEQYMDFLNLLTRAQQVNRVETNISIGTTSITNRYVMTASTTVWGRNGIRCDATIPSSAPVTFYCDITSSDGYNQSDDGQNIVCNYISWPDMAAYSDWAGLRPMTELEYEKAGRGPNAAVYGEFAWGTTNLCSSAYSLTNANTASEGLGNTGTNTGNAIWGNTFSIPARCGSIAASSTNHTRQEAGASYYGVMELTGNLREIIVCLGNIAGRSFTGLHGNGALNLSGFADVDYWPGINGNTQTFTENTIYGGSTGVTESAGQGLRGGDYGVSTSSALTLSARGSACVNYSARQASYGIRLVHSVE